MISTFSSLIRFMVETQFILYQLTNAVCPSTIAIKHIVGNWQILCSRGLFLQTVQQNMFKQCSPCPSTIIEILCAPTVRARKMKHRHSFPHCSALEYSESKNYFEIKILVQSLKVRFEKGGFCKGLRQHREGLLQWCYTT